MFDVVPTRRKGELHASKRAKITNIFLPLMVPEVIFLDCTIQMPENCQNQLIVQLWKTSQQIPTPTPIMKVVELHIVPRVSHNSLRASRKYVTITSKTGTRFDWSTMTSLSRFITTRDEINTVKKLGFSEFRLSTERNYCTQDIFSPFSFTGDYFTSKINPNYCVRINW